MTTPTTPLPRLLRRRAVEDATGTSRSTLYREIQLGMFPPPVSIGGGRVAWPDADIRAMVAARIAGKSDADIRALVSRLVADRTAAAA